MGVIQTQEHVHVSKKEQRKNVRNSFVNCRMKAPGVPSNFNSIARILDPTKAVKQTSSLLQ